MRAPWRCLNVPPQAKTGLFFPREDLNLGVHRTGIAMSDLLVLKLYLQEKY